MIKRFIALIMTCSLLAVAALPVATVSAQNKKDPIGSGLWSGANFDLSGKTARKSSTSKPTMPDSRVYAALGDSVAAGAGLPGQDTQCGRSNQAYPHEVARKTGLTLAHIACSGATAGDLVTKQGVSGPNLSPQLQTAFANGTPRLITITAGANDAHWDDFLRKCYGMTCGTKSDDYIAKAYLTTLKAKLHIAFTDVQRRSNGTPPPVVVTGYYNPLSSKCIAPGQLTAAEISWLNKEAAALNKAIQDVSKRYKKFVKFVPVSFSGHDACSADPWVQGLQDPAPFHPTAKGQSVIAQAVLRAVGY